MPPPRVEVWPALSLGNLEACASLVLEFAQLASFPFQGATSTDADTSSGGGGGDGGGGDGGGGGDDASASVTACAPRWLKSLHGVSYVTDLSPLNGLTRWEAPIVRSS
jgi:hypothetical protein